MNIDMPSGARKIILRLEEHGYRADIVGGCVRDAMLGRRAADFDVTTDARPEAVIDIFSDLRVIETGIVHGTVTVIADGEPYEVTTYRIDGEYSDSRHPDSVSFTSRIEDDLSRRDFTVNAMAYSERHGLTDVFGGRADLNARIIRAVGDPYLRFSEDALRVLRALRFASVLGFGIEPCTAAAATELSPHLSDISVERIYTEWRKLVGGIAAYTVISEYSEIVARILPEIGGGALPPRKSFEDADADARHLALFAAACGSSAHEAFHAAATRLKTDRKTRDIGTLALAHLSAPMENRTELIRLLSEVGEECAELTVRTRIALGDLEGEKLSELYGIIKSGTVYRISDLAVGGNDLLSLGIRGKEIGSALEELLALVISDELPNERDALLSHIGKK